MSHNIWFISDTHFSHSNILTFSDAHGNKVRPQFDSVEQMNEIIIDNWNKTVKPGDKVYHLGDVAFGPKQDWPKLFTRLAGRKRLILGNHDHTNIDLYKPWFEKFMSWRQFKDMPIPFICCHYPLHKDSLYGRGGAIHCVHGHIHERQVMANSDHYEWGNIGKGGMPDWHYINVCVEKINYTPIHMDELQKRMKHHG
jgi:calcineurin-like phosphoesterase family protein